MMKNKKVFISGGAGVIGSALVEKLYKMGAEIFVGDLKDRPINWPLDIHYRKGDLNYISKEEINSFQPEYFFHLAATFERSIETYDFWDENQHHNIKLGHHLMNILKECTTLKKVVFASSYLIYNPDLYTYSSPQNEAYRLNENDEINPRNLTGMAKLLHEMELNFFAGFQETPFKSVYARIFRVYGKNSRDIISRWIRSLLDNEEITVYRKEGIFDYIYAEDVAEGLLRLAQTNVTGIVNLGNDNARSVTEVLNVLLKHFPNMKFQEVESDILYEASQANMDRFRKIANWEPTYQIETAIPEIIEFEREENRKREETIDKSNVLITSISKKVALIKQIKKAAMKFGDIGNVYGGDINKNCIGAFFVDQFWEMPELKKLSLNKLIEFCKENNIKYIIPSRDGELPFFAKYKKDLLDNGIHVMVSNQTSIDLTLDKFLFAEKLSELGYPAIPTAMNIDGFNKVPIVVKERFGAGSLSIGLNLDRNKAIKHASYLSDPIYQPYIKGEEYSVDLYITSKKKSKGVIVRKRDIVENGESQITTTLRNERLENMCAELAEDLNLFGHIVIQVLIDTLGDIHIIEVNARFGGASHLSIQSGLDSFYWFFLESNGQNIDNYPFIRNKREMKLIRYPEDLII